MLTTSTELLAWAIFLSYILGILCLFALVSRSLSHKQGSSLVLSRLNDHRVLIFGSLTAVSLIHTQFYMYKFMAWSFATHETNTSMESISDRNIIARITSWLVNTDLFEQAWATVCRGPMNWWWSEQLCLFTVSIWTVFLATKGREYPIKYMWAYMVLGQIVAISVASNLFYLALILSPSKRKDIRGSTLPTLWLVVMASLVTVAWSPFTTDQSFLPNLLAMHALIIIPLLPVPCAETVSPTLQFFIASAILAVRSVTTIRTLSALPPSSQTFLGFIHTAWDTLHSHPAQASIGWDTIWSLASFAVWIIVAPLDRSPMAKKLAVE